MDTTVTIDLRHVARGTGVPVRQVQAVVELLDDGNTVPFVTRYRKDQTGGLDEEQIRLIQARLAKLRLLAERKQTILRSIESQSKLTVELAKQIRSATSTKRLEDLYLPYKPRKQTLATAARERGLEPLAREILEAAPACADLDTRAGDFVNDDRKVPTGADALLGAGHILAEQFSERAELRQKLREILQRTGKLVSVQIGGDGKKAKAEKPEASPTGPPAEAPAIEEPSAETEPPPGDSATAAAAPDTQGTPASAQAPSVDGPLTQDLPDDKAAAEVPGSPEAPGSAGPEPPSPGAEASVPESSTPAPSLSTDGGQSPSTETVATPSDEIPSDIPGSVEAEESGAAPPPPVADGSTQVAKPPTPKPPTPKPRAPKPPPLSRAEMRKKRSAEKKKKAEERKNKAFRDYFEFREDIKKIPPHRVLAINRGERAKVLRVRIESDGEEMARVAEEMLVPAEHPHADFLRGCMRDALTRLVLPSLEREARRELTDRAEAHAVSVFARNLRNLLLQAPVRDRRVLAVDPGLKSGCKMVGLDQFGNVLQHGIIHLVGSKQRREAAKKLVVELIDRFQSSVVVIGNGTGCRESEQFVVKLLAEELKEKGVSYVIVNEAGASVYSTSRLGREEFPQYDAALRGAISIGRRLQDPLSELVKIDAANIGVGLYQHDVRAKHLRASLDGVVESSVNYVGVDVNTASPALMRYVSGFNQLTARRLYEYRRQHGPFRNREQLKQVPGLGEATFVQSAGFLKIRAGDNPLDTTWIHPESYEAATALLAKLEYTPEDLTDSPKAAALAEKAAGLDVEATAAELNVGPRLLADIIAQLARPGRDPREDLPGPIFRHDVLKMEDLVAGMELTGTVLNVVDFGAFVDIGMHDSGLVHVSHLANKFVRDPHEVVGVGDIVKVWVVAVDKDRRRVSLTMIPPGTEKSDRPRGASGDDKPKPERKPSSGRQGRREKPAGTGARPSGGRRQKSGRPGRPGRSGQGGQQRDYRPRPRPKPVVPITEEMKSGKKPMRTFGDLLQFYDHKESDSKPDTAKKPAQAKKPAKAKKPKKKPQDDQSAAPEPEAPSPQAQPPRDGSPAPDAGSVVPAEVPTPGGPSADGPSAGGEEKTDTQQ